MKFIPFRKTVRGVLKSSAERVIDVPLSTSHFHTSEDNFTFPASAQPSRREGRKAPSGQVSLRAIFSFFSKDSDA